MKETKPCAMMAPSETPKYQFDDMDINPLNRAAILCIVDADVVYVDIPEWGGGVYIKSLTGRQRDELEHLISSGGQLTRAKIAVLCCCDENGIPLFDEEDEEILNDKIATAMDRVFEAAASHNRLRGEDIEEAVKN